MAVSPESYSRRPLRKPDSNCFHNGATSEGIVRIAGARARMVGAEQRRGCVARAATRDAIEGLACIVRTTMS